MQALKVFSSKRFTAPKEFGDSSSITGTLSVQGGGVLYADSDLCSPPDDSCGNYRRSLNSITVKQRSSRSICIVNKNAAASAAVVRPRIMPSCCGHTPDAKASADDCRAELFGTRQLLVIANAHFARGTGNLDVRDARASIERD